MKSKTLPKARDLWMAGESAGQAAISARYYLKKGTETESGNPVFYRKAIVTSPCISLLSRRINALNLSYAEGTQ